MLGLLLLILAIMDHLDIVGESTRVTIGEIILVILQVFNSIGLLFTAIYLLLTLRYIYRIYKRYQECGVNSIFDMLQIDAFKQLEFDPNFYESQHNFFNFLETGEKRPKILRPPRKEQDLSSSPLQGPISFTTEQNLNLTQEASAFHLNQATEHGSPHSVPLFKTTSRLSIPNIKINLVDSPRGAGLEFELDSKEPTFRSHETPASSPPKQTLDSPSHELRNSFDLGTPQFNKDDTDITIGKNDDISSVKDEEYSSKKTFEKEQEDEESKESESVKDSMEIKSSIDSDGITKRREDLLKTFKKLRHRKESHKTEDVQKADQDITNIMLPEESELEKKQKKNNVIEDLRKFKNKQNKMKQKAAKDEKKNWYDGLRKLKDKIGKGNNNKDVINEDKDDLDGNE